MPLPRTDQQPWRPGGGGYATIQPVATGGGGNGGTGFNLNGVADGLSHLLTPYKSDPTKFQFDATQSNQARDQQSQLSQLLFQQANGGGPQLAAAQERAATDRNIAQAYAMAQANPYDPGAARNAANNVAMANQDAAQQSAQLQMQQQLAAQGQLGGVLGAMRGQDINVGGQQLGANMSQQQLDQNSYYGTANNGMKVVGGVLGGVGAAASMLAAHGGQVPMYAHGGAAQPQPHVPSISIILPNTYAATGGQVPGQASVPGDDYANDTVAARLSPGEIVLPRSVTDDPDAAEKAKLFVQAIEKQSRKAR